jgi:serine/threonine-protein kinase
MQETPREMPDEWAAGCPPVEVLWKYSVGDLPWTLLARVEEHVAHCAECVETLDAVDSRDDECLAFLRDARGNDAGMDFADTGLVRRLAAQGSVDEETSAPAANGHAVGVATSEGQRFRVLRPHAEGGLGAVFVALDGEFNREVAFKQILDHHADDPSSRRRFLIEAQITGNLEHPGIVPVYAMGAQEGGRPYYAMRLVNGENFAEMIQHFHDGRATAGKQAWRGVAFRKLLGQFLDVCNVIAYAHSKGVIHRDLKPRNIMGGPFGETLVLDWGLARALARPDEPAGAGSGLLGASPEPRTAGTCPGTAVGTPQFMSPEQAAGRAECVGAASDVYSLGATLFGLLTGKAPFCDPDLEVILQKVQRGEFPRPRAIDPTIPRPLEAICLQAMAREPADRYPSPRALADDLEKWLADEPVSAWPEPVSSKLRRAVARHRTLVTTGVALAVLALVALGVLAEFQRRSNRQLGDMNRNLTQANQRAEMDRVRAEDRVELALLAIQQFQQSVSQNLDVKNRPDLKALRQTLLQAPRDFYRQLMEAIEDNPDSQPETRAKLAEAMLGLGQITALLDSESEAIQLYENAAGLLDDLLHGQPDRPGYRFLLAGALDALSLLENTTGRAAVAMSHNEEARDLYQGLVALDSAQKRYQFGLAVSEEHLGVLRRAAGQPDQALASFEHARQLLQRLAREDSNTSEYQAQLALVLNDLGVLQRALGRPRDALATYEQSRDTLDGLVRDHPAIATYQRGLALVWFNIGTLYGIELLAKGAGNPVDALEKGRVILQGLVDKNPTVGEYRAELAKTCGQIGAMKRYGAPAEALIRYGEARDLLVGLVRDHPENTKYRSDLALTHFLIGDRQIYFGRFAEALASLEPARILSEALVREVPHDHKVKLQLGVTHEGRGHALAGLGRFPEAVAAYREALPALRRAHDQAPASPQFRTGIEKELLHNFEGLAQALRKLDRQEEALEALRAACALLEPLPQPIPVEMEDLARLYSVASDVIERCRRPERPDAQAESRAYADRAISLLRELISNHNTGLQRLRQTREFDPIRPRADFQLLVLDAAFPINPFAD